MENRNITLSLPAELLRSAKVYAAEHDTTINGFVRELLEDALSQKSRRQAAVARILEIVDRGPYSMIDPRSVTREEMHERR